MNDIMNISGVECYEQDGVAYLKLEAVARGLGFTKTETKNDTEYMTIRWERVFGFLEEIGFDHKWAKDSFIPENVFYRLAMKAKNETAERFQAKIADEVIPSIRRHGAYMTPEVIEKAILNPDFIMQLAQKLKEEMEARRQAETALRESESNVHLLDLDNRRLRPKADYFDALVDKNMLTSLRETAKLFHVKERKLIKFLVDNRFLYRSASGTLLPYATRPADQLFEVKEARNEKTGWFGLQTLVTPRGRETFRLLLKGEPESGLWGWEPEGMPSEMMPRDAERSEAYYRKLAQENK